MKNIKKIIIASGMLLLSIVSFSQQIVNHQVNFNSGLQNMWGESWSAYSIDASIELFDYDWDLAESSSSYTTLAGETFGYGVDFGFSGRVGSNISLEGFTTGTVDVDYPVDIVLNMNADATYDQGDTVAIKTDYSVGSGYAINTLYPSLGELKWDLYFQFAAHASVELCFFGCTTFPVIPNFDTGLQTINLFTASGNGASTGGETGVWWLGAGDPLTIPPGPGIAGWPFSLSPQVPPYVSPSEPGNAWIPWQVHLPVFPAEFETPIGFGGEITIPYVETTTTISGNALQACGDSTYLSANIEIFKFLGFIVSNAPAPFGNVGTVLSNLSGSVDVGPANVNWNLFSAAFEANITNKQCFDFDPSVWGRFEFPVPVDYQIYDSVSGTLSALQTSSIINFELGQEIRYKYPCYFEDLDIVPTYYIDGTVANFRNHTWDEFTFNFVIKALGFGVTIPAVNITPAIDVPEYCVNVPYPCPSWSNPFRWCSYTACTPAFTIPAVSFAGLTYTFGPLLDETVPIASFTYDWYDHTWALEGFQDTTLPAFRMTASPLGITNTFTDVACFGGTDGSINVTTSAISPALPYTFLWTNAATMEDITNLSAGNYDIEIIDANNCQMFTGATISEPEQPITLSFSSTNKNCNGGPDDGSINLTVVGGTPGYTYLWSNGQTTNSLAGLAAGVYSVTVTDSRNCTASGSVTITEPNVLGQVGAVTDVNCNGDADGQIAIDVFGGTLPYSYSWTGPAAYSSNLEDIIGLSGGNYTLVITDGNLCTSTMMYTVNEPVAPLALSSTAMNVACKDDSTGSIDLTVVGGTPGYSFSWATSTGIVLPFVTEDLNGIPAENYTVTVTDANGCSAQHSQLVVEPVASIASSEVLVHINCFGDAAGEIDPVISGGTAPYTYAWSNGATSPTIIGLLAGSYSLTVTDANFCTASYSYTLTEPAAALLVTTLGTDVLCKGDATGAIVSTVSGGTEPYSYAWSSGETSSSITNLIAGNYNLIVTDAKGCTASIATMINEPLLPLTSTSVIVDVDCFGNNSGAIDVTPNGGTAPYTFVWSNGSSIVLSSTTEDLTNMIADTYTVEITDANGCINTLVSTINGPSAPIAISGIETAATCFGANDGAVDISVSGGTTAYSYAWSNGATSQDIGTLVSGSYTVVVTDNNLCVDSMEFTINQPSAPIAIELVTTDVLCNGDATGGISSSVTGGTAPYTYAWSNGVVTEDNMQIVANSYTLTVTDDNGCIAFTGATVNEPAMPLTFVPTVTDASCFEYSDGEIVIAINGGTQPYYFNWGNQNEILLNNASETLSGLAQGDYFVRVRDDNGCLTEQIVTVNHPAPYVASAVISDALCFEDSTGAIDLILVGGTMPYSVQWNNGASTEDLTNIPSGNYVFTSTDNQGCEITGEYFVDQPNVIDISEEVIGLTCIDQNDAAIFIYPYGGTKPYDYTWSNGQTSQNIEDLLAGQYNVIVGDFNGCSQTFNFEIYENDDECIGIPNTFTPNGDDYNDTWLIRNIDLYPNASVKVFNRWGNEIYVSEGTYKPWDGLYNGKPLPSEVYYYIIVLDNDQDNKYTGTITIIR